MTLRAVVVDDSVSLRLLTRLALEDVAGTEIVGEASGALEALALIEQLRPDAAVIDIHMPGMDGVELIRTLRANGSALRLVAYSSDESSLVAALRVGADAAVLKTPMCLGLHSALAG